MRMAIYTLLTLVFLVCSVPAANCAEDESSAFTKGELKINGVTRVFYYHLPKRYRGAPTPIIFLFHGGGGDALPFASDIRFSERADEDDFIAVAPQGYDHRWNYGVDVRSQSKENDIEFSNQMIAYMESHFKVDAQRIYFGGFSEGAWFTQWATYHIPNKIAAAAAVCGLEPVQWELIYGKGHPRLPICFMLGTGDPRMHWEGGITPNGTNIISANGTVWSWVRADECGRAGFEMLPDKSNTDGSRVELTAYRGRQADDVFYYKVVGGGHAWPGAVRSTSPNGNVNEDIDATQLIWDFFKTHPKRTPGLPAPFVR